MTGRLHITEVAPRDGLQGQPAPLPTDGKLAFIRSLHAAGLRSIELTSFVSPKAVPQMADAAGIVAGSAQLPGLDGSVLVPNLRGLDLAQQAGAQCVAVVLGATDTLNRRNIGMGMEQAIASCEAVLRVATDRGLRSRAYLALAFECPYEGRVAPARSAQLAQLLHDAGAGELVLADTIGAAGPHQVRELVRLVGRNIPPDRLGLHLHDTRGLGLANAWAGIEAGVRRFDASAGGIGGCPFAPGAAGNLATEDLVLLAHQAGFHTGVDLLRLQEAIAVAEGLLARSLGGRSMAWQRRAAILHPQSQPQGDTHAH